MVNINIYSAHINNRSLEYSIMFKTVNDTGDQKG